MGLGTTLKKYRWILLGIVVAALLCVTVVFGVRYYQYRKTAEYTFAKFQAALVGANVPQLAVLVDFRRITEHLARETARTFPFFQAGPDQIQKISGILQTHALKLLRHKPEPSEDAKITDMAELLKKPVYVVPPDVVSQMAQNLSLSKSNSSIVITTSFEHPLFKRKFPVVLSLMNSNDGWIIHDLLNAHELATTFRSLLEERLQAQRDLVYRKADKLVKTMHETLDVQSCTAQAGLISDHRTLLVVVNILARNKTGLTIKNVNATTEILNQNNQVLLRRQLSSTEPTPPSSDFSHNWTIELDGTSAEGKKILNAGPLSCRATWRTLTMSNSRVYHAETPPKKVGPCPKHKDGHPEGLCSMEIFSQK